MTRFARRRALGTILPLLLTGCYGGPASWVATTPKSTGDVYPCAFREVNERGYTVTSASRDGGFIAAEKRRSGVTNAILAREEVDHINASIYDDSVPGQRKLRVTVSATRASQVDPGKGTVAIGPSEEAIADAERLVTSCADGVVVRR